MGKTEDFIGKAERFGAKNYAPIPVVIERGKGIYLYDVEGKRYFDMLSAYSAVNQGHQHPKIVKAAIEQMKRLALTSRAFHNDKMPDFLQKVSEITGMPKVLPMNTGAEGVETAVKAMKKWGYETKRVEKDKAEIIVAAGNFHGRTTTIIGFSVDETTKSGFGPFTPGFKIIPYNNVEALEDAVNKNTVGFLVEPIQGEAGVIIPAKDYMQRVRDVCTKKNILLCLDEIQTGLGRTGKMFCYEYAHIKPDMLILGKALSGGLYPISVMATSEEVMKVFTPGTHGSTYGGNPLASAIAIAALEVITEENLPARAAEQGEYFLEKLKTLKNENIKEVRGKGLMLAIEMYKPIAKEVCKKLAKEGVLVKDTHETTIRLAPPLIISKKQIDEAFKRIKKVF
ncbi:ornithine--oxo-acid transaminase [Candidatus Woesearchaeota archaeon]|nr:ornithine--oxo-acid transaminase [Candidatus Woesearchaeota archaeon]